MTGYKSKKKAAQAKLDSMEREALNLALEALEVVTKELLAVRDELAERGARPKTNAFHQKLWDSSFKAYTDHALPAATAIKEALAQPAQEPVAWMHVQGNYEEPSFRQLADDEVERGWQQYPLYTTPPQRPWIDLTDNQIEQIYYDLVKIHRGAPMPWGQIQFGKVLQAAIREANK